MRSPCFSALFVSTCLGLMTGASAETLYPATLAGHVVLPALSFVAPPADVPADLKVTGKFTTGRRVDQLGTVEILDDGRPTGPPCLYGDP